MKTNLLKRLEALEAQYKQNPLIVLASTDSGEEIKITMRECLERQDVHFIKVIAGSSLQDLDLLLKAIEEEARKQVPAESLVKEKDAREPPSGSATTSTK